MTQILDLFVEFVSLIDRLLHKYDAGRVRHRRQILRQRLRRSLEKSAVLDQNQTPLAEKWHRVRQTDQLVHIQPFSLEIIVVHRIIARDSRPQLLFITLLQKRLFAV